MHYIFQDKLKVRGIPFWCGGFQIHLIPMQMVMQRVIKYLFMNFFFPTLSSSFFFFFYTVWPQFKYQHIEKFTNLYSDFSKQAKKPQEWNFLNSRKAD